MSKERLYNIEELELHTYRKEATIMGTCFISVALIGSILGFIVISHPYICCQKLLIFIFALFLVFTFFSFLVFGSGLVLISSSSESYLYEFCNQPKVSTNYQQMLVEII
jgi:hypothetical protein